jgi:hypothetical protein
MCQVEAGSDGLRVLPSRNGGNQGNDRGYHTLEELAADLSDTSSDEELGSAVLFAVAACR